MATGEFVEPVQLQVVCQSLWRDLPPEVTIITQDHLQAFGDVNQALSGFYERSIKRVAQEPGVKEGDLRSWFEHKLITLAGTRGTVYRGREKTGGIPNSAMDVFENLHLIRGEWRAGARWYELTHDRFIEPIQESNKMWRKKRRTVWAFRATVATPVVILMIVFATVWATQSEKLLGSIQAVVFARGQLYDDLGQYEQALAYYQWALEIAKGIGDREREGSILNNIGAAYENLAQYKEALKYYEEALAISREVGNQKGEGDALGNIGDVYEALGQYEQALNYYQRALAIMQEIGDRVGERATLDNIGGVYHDLGQYERALDYYQQALAIAQEIGDREGEGTTLKNIGAVYDDLGQYEQALNYYQRASMVLQTEILPETKRLQEVQFLDADGDGKDERVVFYKFDLFEGVTGRKFSPIGAAVYNDDHGDPPVIFPYELRPPYRVHLGEQNCVAWVKDLIPTTEGPELLVGCFSEEGLVVDLSVFHWYDHDKDDLSKNPSEERQGYECLGFFHGSGGITLAESEVIVKERTEERSQLSVKNVYNVREGSYFQPGGKELWPPVEKSVEFTFGVPEDVAQSPYPEKIVLAFYLALGQNNPLAQTYLSEASGLKNLVGSSNFGTAADGDKIQRVLVKRIIYTPDREKEEKHELVWVTITVSSVTNVGEDPPRDVTWEVIWESAPEGAAKPGWKLHRMITR